MFLLIKIDPENFLTLYNCAYCLVQNREYSKALQYLQKIFVQNPDNIFIIQMIAYCYQKLDQIDQACIYYNKVWSESSIIIQYSQMLIKHQFYNKSLDLLGNYLKIQQDSHVRKTFDIANALMGINSFQKSGRAPVPLYNQGVFYYHQGRL